MRAGIGGKGVEYGAAELTWGGGAHKGSGKKGRAVIVKHRIVNMDVICYNVRVGNF